MVGIPKPSNPKSRSEARCIPPATNPVVANHHKRQMSVPAYLVILILSIVTARPIPIPQTPQTRDVKALGPGGILDPEQRWSDTVGTALQAWMNGLARKHSVLHSSETGPISEVFRDVLRRVHETYKARNGYKREIAINSFGGVGEVHYDFSNPIENVQGRSTQVLVACRCVGKECNTAILIRPINVFANLPPDANEKPVRRTCIYEAVGSGFSDCHSELLRTVRRPVDQGLEYTHGNDTFVYTVDEPSSKSIWTAQGQRGWTRDCLLSDVNALPTASMEDLKVIQRNTHSTPPDNGCKPPNDQVQYFREADPEAGEACYATYEYASAAASQLGSQHDGVAIGLRQEAYVDPKPSLVSNTELALTCSAAGLGALLLYEIYRTRRSNAHRAGKYLFRVVMIQVLSYALESLPLHIALGQEAHARSWESEFAHVGGSMALGSDQLGPQESAEGSVLVMTAVLGTVKYNVTRVSLVAAATVSFDVVAFSIIVATLLTRKRPRLPRLPGLPRLPRRFNRWMGSMRRYPPSGSQENAREQLGMEAKLRQQPQNVGPHVTSVGMSDAPSSADIAADVVPPIGHGVHGTATAFTSPLEQTVAGGDGSNSREGTEDAEAGLRNDRLSVPGS